ncbi:hypothetical protein [Ruegeria arenilitoris]|uniref:hypothetical protein n=1 Tax=Ruegeria arenilitoris TaxID=1173585 RepID=UPI001479FA40|nr:hypothetical protein [Ruegeria arenilitoris]
MGRRAPLTRLLTADQVVEKFEEAGLNDVGKSWLKNQADRGELPYVVVARKRRFRQDLIEEIIYQWCEEAK